MGCTASKLDNEDTVRRCKERRRLIKEAVQSRHHLASAHSDYLRSLVSTGSALTRFARGEPLPVSQQTPPILLHSSTSNFSSLPPSTPQPPPPPPPPFSPSPSPTIASSKLPHILSDSSAASTPFNRPPAAAAAAAAAAVKYPRYPAVNSNYASTPSQASSVWDWENFYPPSPPDSDFFDRMKQEREKEEQFQFRNHHLQEEDEEEEEEEEDEEQGREEIHCSEWGEQHYTSSTTSSTTKSNGGEDDDEDNNSRSEGFAARSEFGGSESISRPAPSEIGSSVRKSAPRDRSDTGSSSGWTARDDASVAGDLRMVVRHRDLAEIVAALEEFFVKAAGAGEQVSEILENGRAQLDRSFRQLKSEFEGIESGIRV